MLPILHLWLATMALVLWWGSVATLAQAPAPPPSSPSAPPSSYPNIKVGVTLFADYTHTASPDSTDTDGNTFSPGAFNLRRSYVNVTGSLSPVIAFRFTPDIAQEEVRRSSLSGSLVFRVKYAYLQANLDKWLTTGSWVRFGMVNTAYVNFAEDVYRYRFQGPIMVDREGYLLSSDAGAAFHYNLPSDYGDLQVGIYNGEGFTDAEVNDQKALQARGTVRPFAKGGAGLNRLQITGFYQSDHYVKNADRRRALGSVTYEHKYLNAGIDYLDATDQTSARVTPVQSSGYSMWATPKSWKGWEGLLRRDHLTTNEALDETKTRTIVGGAYWVPLAGGVSTAFLLDYERVSYTNVQPVLPTEQRIALHVLLSF